MTKSPAFAGLFRQSEKSKSKDLDFSDCRKTVFLESRETRFFSILVSKFKNIDKIE